MEETLRISRKRLCYFVTKYWGKHRELVGLPQLLIMQGALEINALSAIQVKFADSYIAEVARLRLRFLTALSTSGLHIAARKQITLMRWLRHFGRGIC